MARTPRGTRPQGESRTALFAYIAARLAGHPTRAFDGLFQAWGLAVRADSALRAASRTKRRVPARGRPGRKGAGPTAAAHGQAQGIFREWLLVDESKLDLEAALIRFPGTGSRQNELIDGLGRTTGIRHVVETSRARDVYAIAVFAGPQARRELRAQLEELAAELIWEDVLWETQEPAIETWRNLAHRAAEAEGLVADDS
jgi:hypothetical protein